MLASAFDSAGQRCSALRVLCVQEDIADRLVEMLRGAMARTARRRPDRLATDVGPVIDAEARDGILRPYRARCADAAIGVHQAQLPTDCARRHLRAADADRDRRASRAAAARCSARCCTCVRYRRDGCDALLERVNAPATA